MYVPRLENMHFVHRQEIKWKEFGLNEVSRPYFDSLIWLNSMKSRGHILTQWSIETAFRLIEVIQAVFSLPVFISGTEYIRAKNRIEKQNLSFTVKKKNVDFNWVIDNLLISGTDNAHSFRECSNVRTKLWRKWRKGASVLVCAYFLVLNFQKMLTWIIMAYVLSPQIHSTIWTVFSNLPGDLRCECLIPCLWFRFVPDRFNYWLSVILSSCFVGPFVPIYFPWYFYWQLQCVLFK